MVYAGIGSRKTPHEVLAAMSALATVLAHEGWTLRSGGADGADAAFAEGVPAEHRGRVEIFVPWTGYNGVQGPEAVLMDRMQFQAAERFVSAFHDAWHRCGRGARKLHARNAAIVHGANLKDPVDAVICWTPNAVTVGGTATGIRMARGRGIPVFNLARHSAAEVQAAMKGLARENDFDHA